MSTVYILGAGASFASTAPEAKIPLQKGFFSRVASSDLLPLQMLIELLTQEPILNWLKKAGYGDPWDLRSRIRMDRDLNLEDFYSEIENDQTLINSAKNEILRILDRFIFQAVAIPVTSLRNDPKKACPYHREISERLQSEDTIISFNYDSLMDDALLHFSDYWHPITGYGIKFDNVFGGAPHQKVKIFLSQVLLLKPHGSVTFRYKTINNKTLVRLVSLTTGIQPLPMSMSEAWEPFIVPPSSTKSGHRNYMQHILAKARSKIQSAEQVVVIGYSFPTNDHHVISVLRNFVGKLIIVNPDWQSSDYSAKIENMGFSSYQGYQDFIEFFESI